MTNNDQLSLKDIEGFVVPLYEKIYMTGDGLESKAWELIMDNQSGIFASLQKDGISIPQELKNETIVLRTFLTSSKSFRKFCRAKGGVGFSKVITLPLPKFVWITEITTLSMWKMKKTFGMLIFDATASIREANSLIWAIYPERLRYFNRSQAIPPKDGKMTEVFPLKEIKFDMYIHNLGG
ncbi:MAG: hypothetical protein HQK84_11300 [Nitrospinae bacterium]|nr:hypothetical protein [Nitrospinota bacterium]